VSTWREEHTSVGTGRGSLPTNELCVAVFGLFYRSGTGVSFTASLKDISLSLISLSWPKVGLHPSTMSTLTPRLDRSSIIPSCVSDITKGIIFPVGMTSIWLISNKDDSSIARITCLNSWQKKKRMLVAEASSFWGIDRYRYRWPIFTTRSLLRRSCRNPYCDYSIPRAANTDRINNLFAFIGSMQSAYH
jgi:hypothetical protein